MQIRNLGLQEETRQAVLKKSQQSRLAVDELLNTAAVPVQNADTQPGLSISPKLLEIFKSLLDSYGDFSLLHSLNEILKLLDAIRASGPSRQVSELIAKIQGELGRLQSPLSSREFSSFLLRDIVQLYSGLEDTQLELLTLSSLLPDPKDAVLLRTKTDELMSYLDAFRSFNQEGVRDAADKNGFLYFPFTVNSGGKKDDRIELIINPRFDKENKIDQDQAGVVMNLDTEELGRLRISVQVTQKDVVCRVLAEEPLTKEKITRGKEALSHRLKRIRFSLRSFECRLASVWDGIVASLLPHVELDA